MAGLFDHTELGTVLCVAQVSNAQVDKSATDIKNVVPAGVVVIMEGWFQTYYLALK